MDMQKKKLLIIGISVVVVITVILAGLAIFIGSRKSEFGPGAQKTVERYTDLIVQGNSDESYQMLADVTKNWLSREDFSEYVSVQRDEIDVNYIIDASKSVDDMIVKEEEKEVTYHSVPLIKTFYKEEGGEKIPQKKEEVLLLDKNGENYDVVINYSEFREEMLKGTIGKAKEYAMKSLAIGNDDKKIQENISKIDIYVGAARKWAEDHEKEKSVMLECDLLDGYKLLASGDLEGAAEYVRTLGEQVKEYDDLDYRIRVQVLMAEISLAKNDYETATKALDAAVKIDGDNEAIRKERTRVKSTMVQKIKSHLNIAWAQVRSAAAIENPEERIRIARDVVLFEAEEGLKINASIPDAYFVKANAYFLMGENDEALNHIDKALELAKSDDVVFSSMVAQLRGMVSMSSTPETLNLEGYKSFTESLKWSSFLSEADTTGVMSIIG